MPDAYRISVVVPTYNERENIEELVVRLSEAMHDAGYGDFEIVVVDDNSPDGTAEVVRDLSRKYPIKLIKRPGKLGLGSAIMEGIKTSGGELIVIMDADLQHPPEVIPTVIEKLKEGCDIVVASRYIAGGGIENWPLSRSIISRGATLLAYMLLPPCRSVKDPLSGFFGFRRTIINGIGLNPKSFKVLLEILCKAKWKNVCEVPYVFSARQKGKSKLTLREIVKYVKHLLEIRSY
ncbi:MAG: polyprenol monophosphomannose synthase [Zestosphaera sp.]|nr:polyprenol monophosphomannose synthase [Thermoproteota archaeon]